ncbi:MAG: NAD(P)H-hydrate dehydratase [Zestosphaera sp.]
MEVLRSDELRAADINSIFWGVSTQLLMENAGAGVARVVREMTGGVAGRVAVVAGVGGKAGDSFVMARHLAGDGYEVQVFLVSRLIKHEDARSNLEILRDQANVVIRDYSPGMLFGADVVVDGLLGIGVKGAPRDLYAEAIKSINNSGGLKVAIDVPSGLDPDTGEAPGDVVRADATVTLVAPKPGLLKAPGVVGRLIVVNIGIPPNAFRAVGPGDVEVWFRKKDFKAKKGDGGKVLVVTGSRDYVGAPWLTALGAWAAGADLVYLAAPEYVLESRFSPEVIGVPLSGDYLARDHVIEVMELVRRVDVVASGPGLTVSEGVRGFVEELVKAVRACGKALVLDADALKVIRAGELEGLKAVITPHLGEAAKLLGMDAEKMRAFEDTVDARIAIARDVVERYRATLLLKGYVDVIMAPDGRVKRRMGVGHQDMSCGGTGDVLTGITATSLARSGDPFRAASAAAFINAVAGELAYLIDGRSSPTNILKYVPQVVRDPLKMALKVKEMRVRGE